jgi:hypothetical protein
MSEQPTLSANELERRIRLLREAMSRMALDDLCKLIHDIQALGRKTNPGSKQ